MTAYSRHADLQLALQIKIRRAKCQAKAQHKDMKTKNPAWCRDASKGDYTMLIKTITEQVKLKQQRNETFERKLHQDGKN